MGVRVVCHANVRVPHDVLELRGVHPLTSHLGAERVSAYMRGNLGKFLFVDAIVLAEGELEVLLPVHRNLRHVVFVQKQESAHPVNDGLDRWVGTLLKDCLETFFDFLGHGHESLAAFRFGAFDVVPHIAAPLQLLVDADASVFEIEVRFCEAAELRDAQPRVEEDVEHFVISRVMLISLDEIEEPALVLWGQGLARNGVVDEHGGELEVERVAPDEVVFLRKLESWAKYSSNAVNRAVAFPELALKIDEPIFRVERRYIAGFPASELVLGERVHNRLIACARSRAHRRLGRDVLFNQFENGHPAWCNAVKQIALHLLLDFAEAQPRLFTLGREVVRGERPRVLVLRLASRVFELEIVLAVRALSLSLAKDAPLAVFPRGHSCHLLSLRMRPDAASLVHRGA